VKNRLEQFYNLSLTVKDINSVYDSIAQQLQGEIISDFNCDGCGKKVDISKRSLISKCPNVLIVHNQRLVFNFETFRNDKLNSLFKFPHVLDLKQFSYYDVMEKEGRLKKKASEDDDETEVKDEDLTPEELAKKKQDEEDFQQPEEENCFEYKLVGVNVHSGPANAGHYWSYINTNRGTDETDGDPTWI
jgi:ubiquitin C-terminal hydrolase